MLYIAKYYLPWNDYKQKYRKLDSRSLDRWPSFPNRDDTSNEYRKKQNTIRTFTSRLLLKIHPDKQNEIFKQPEFEKLSEEWKREESRFLNDITTTITSDMSQFYKEEQ